MNEERNNHQPPGQPSQENRPHPPQTNEHHPTSPGQGPMSAPSGQEPGYGQGAGYVQDPSYAQPYEGAPGTGAEQGQAPAYGQFPHGSDGSSGAPHPGWQGGPGGQQPGYGQPFPEQQFAGAPGYQGAFGNGGGAPKKKTGLIIAIVAAVVIVITAIVLIFVLTGGKGDKEARVREFLESTVRPQFAPGEYTEEQIDEAFDCVSTVFAEHLTDEQIDDLVEHQNVNLPPEVEGTVTVEVMRCLPPEMIGDF